MLKSLFIIILSLLLQACQVDEQTTSSKQAGNVNFPGARFLTVMPQDGWKKLGDNIDITLVFPTTVKVIGMPYIESTIGSYSRRFYYESGSDTTSLIFRYTVTSSDLDSNGIQVDDEIKLNNGSITYSPQLDLVQNVPTQLELPDYFIAVDGVAPYQIQTVAPVAGNYTTGTRLNYSLTFSEKVYVNGLPTFSVNLNSGTILAAYRTGSGSTSLQFSHILQLTDADVDGFSNGTLLSLNSSSGITITDAAGNSIPSTIYAAPTTGIFINVIQPTITSITPPAAATYTNGQNLDFIVTMSEAVNVTGMPVIPITLNSGPTTATYVSGSGTTSLLFRYTVAPNQVDPDGISLVSPMLLNSGTIKNLAGTQDAAMIFSPPSTVGQLVDAAVGPYVVTGLVPNAGTRIEAQNLDFSLNFNKIVTVTGTPRLPLLIGTTTVYADYISGSGSSTLTFRYTTTTSDQDMDGITLLSPIDLNGGSINDAALKPAILAYIPPSTNLITVDGSTPVISSIAAGTSGVVSLGHQINVNVTFSEPVIVNGSPILEIDIDGVTKNANYITGSGTDTLLFRYTVLAGESDSDGVMVNTINLNGGTIRDPRAHNADLTFVPLNLASLLVDAAGPTIDVFTTPMAGNYNIGDTLDFDIIWSEPTFISGNPRIAMTAGSQTLYATYVSSLSDSTHAVFRYTILANNLAPAGVTAMNFQLNGGQVKDATGNAANTTLPIVALPGVNLDGVAPYVTAVSSPANGTYKAGQTLDFTLTWSENITFTGVSNLNLVIGATTVSAALISSTANTGTFSYTVLSGQLDTDGINLLSAVALSLGVTIQDAAGNDSYLQINSPVLTGVKVDAILPTIAAITPPVAETYKLLEYVDFVVNWSEPVIITGSPRLAFNIDSELPTTMYATYNAAASTSTQSVFRYQVATGDEDTDGISLVGTTLDLNAGTIRDAATNDATLTFSSPSMSGVLIDGVRANIDPTNPVTPPADGLYAIGDPLDFTINWTENVTVDTTGGVPYIRVMIGSTLKNATYVSGSGTPNIVFRYTVTSGDSDNNGVEVWSPVYTNGGTIRDTATNDVYTTFTLQYFPLITLDGIVPYVVASSSSNITEPSKPNYFKTGQTIQYNVTFNETVKRTGGVGTPRLALDIGGNIRYASYFSGDNSSILTFRYTIDASDTLLDLDGISVSSTIDESLGTLEDVNGNPISPTITFLEKDMVYYTGVISRYRISGSDYNTASCDAGANACVSLLKDITGNGHNMTPDSNSGPRIYSGFGTMGTSYMKFNNQALLRTATSLPSVKYVAFVLKSVPNPSVSGITSNHSLLTRRYYTGAWTYSSSYYTGCTTYNSFLNKWFCPVVALESSQKLTSNSAAKSVVMAPAQRMKINDNFFTAVASTSESAPTLWLADTHYIMIFELSTATNFEAESYLGGSTFDGAIAEVLFLSSAPAMTEATHIDQIREQLNDIHGVY